MSKKDCGNHGSCKRHKLYRLIAAWTVGIVVLVLLAVLIIWLVLRPTKPRFLLQDATVLQLNLTGPSLLSVTLQVTISSRNPNDRIGIYYDRLDAFAEYKDQQVTLATAMPPGYQGHNDVDVWSPYLYGEGVPIAPFVAAELAQDEGAGFLLLKVKIDGRLRWKVGTWISGHYHIYVDCPALLAYEDGKATGVAPSLKFQQITGCSVDV